jgi:hypothetical protein
MEKKSTVVAFLQMIWYSVSARKDWSRIRMNTALQSGLSLAINARFKFQQDDFSEIADQLNFFYWGGSSYHATGESFYSMACDHNRSAAIAYEKWQKRKPFIYFGKSLAIVFKFNWWEKIPEEAEDKSKRKMIIESGYKAIKLNVSSFSKCGNYLNAVWYSKPKWKRKPGAMPDKRFRLTREDLKAVEKALR